MNNLIEEIADLISQKIPNDPFVAELLAIQAIGQSFNIWFNLGRGQIKTTIHLFITGKSRLARKSLQKERVKLIFNGAMVTKDTNRSTGSGIWKFSVKNTTTFYIYDEASTILRGIKERKTRYQDQAELIKKMIDGYTTLEARLIKKDDDDEDVPDIKDPKFSFLFLTTPAALTDYHVPFLYTDGFMNRMLMYESLPEFTSIHVKPMMSNESVIYQNKVIDFGEMLQNLHKYVDIHLKTEGEFEVEWEKYCIDIKKKYKNTPLESWYDGRSIDLIKIASIHHVARIYEGILKRSPVKPLHFILNIEDLKYAIGIIDKCMPQYKRMVEWGSNKNLSRVEDYLKTTPGPVRRTVVTRKFHITAREMDDIEKTLRYRYDDAFVIDAERPYRYCMYRNDKTCKECSECYVCAKSPIKVEEPSDNPTIHESISMADAEDDDEPVLSMEEKKRLMKENEDFERKEEDDDS